MISAKKIYSVLLVSIICLLFITKSVFVQETAGELFEKALYMEEARGELQKAIDLYQKIVRQFPKNREVAAKSQLHIGLCYEKLGKDEAQKAYQRVIEEFADQQEVVTEARARLVALEQPAKTTDASEVVIRRVWADAVDFFFSGAPSPDGKYLSYVDWETGVLGVRELASGTNRALTRKDPEYNEFAQYSVFSPSSKQIAYSWINREGFGELRIIGLEGYEPRVLYRNEEVKELSPADWSSDGKHILAHLITKDRTHQIVLVAVADGSVRILKELDWLGLERMSLSPDGRHIIYNFPQQEDSENRDIYLLDVDGSREIPLIQHPADDFVLGWASDGRRVVFGSNRSGSMGVWIIEVAEGKPQKPPEMIKMQLGEFQPLGLSRNNSFYYGLLSGWSAVYTAKLDLEKSKLLSSPVQAFQRFEGEGSNLYSAPEWSPDGNSLVCLVSRIGRNPLLLIRSFDTGEVRELAPKLKSLNFHCLRWSPDGRTLLGAGHDLKERWGLLQIGIQTGDVTTIAHMNSDSGGAIFQPGWTPEGNTVFYKRMALPTSKIKDVRIIRRERETGQEQELYRSPGNFLYLTPSPDGQQLAFYADSTVKLLSVAGGQPKELIRIQDITTIDWTPDGRQLLYGKRTGQDEITELWRIPAEGGEPQKLELTMRDLLAMRYMLHLRVHPDGQRIAFTAKAQPGKVEVWVMENFLPELKAAQ